MDGVEINCLDLIAEDYRGKTFERDFRSSSNLILGYRKKNSIMGQHFHKGIEESKKPEQFFLLNGKIKAFFKNRKGEEEESIIIAPCMIQINPYVYHEFTAYEDVIFIELKQEHDEYKDNFNKEEFRKVIEDG